MNDLAQLIGGLRRALAKMNKLDVLDEERLCDAVWLAQFLPLKVQG